MLAQTTDSGSNNHTLAYELQRMFQEATPSVDWPAGRMQIRCYAHKLALLVKHGLASIGLDAGHTKPTTQPLFNIPTPSITLNDGTDEMQVDEEDETEESDASESGICDGESDSDGDDNDQLSQLPAVLPGSTRSRPDLVIQAIKKVSFLHTLTIFLLPILISISPDRSSKPTDCSPSISTSGIPQPR